MILEHFHEFCHASYGSNKNNGTERGVNGLHMNGENETLTRNDNFMSTTKNEGFDIKMYMSVSGELCDTIS